MHRDVLWPKSWWAVIDYCRLGAYSCFSSRKAGATKTVAPKKTILAGQMMAQNYDHQRWDFFLFVCMQTNGAMETFWNHQRWDFFIAENRNQRKKCCWKPELERKIAPKTGIREKNVYLARETFCLPSGFKTFYRWKPELEKKIAPKTGIRGKNISTDRN